MVGNISMIIGGHEYWYRFYGYRVTSFPGASGLGMRLGYRQHHNAKNISLLGTLSCGNGFCNWILWYLLSFSQYHPFLTNTLHTHMRMRLPVSMWQTCTTNLHFNNAVHMLYINPQGQPSYHFYHVVVHTLHSTQREVSKAAGRGKHFQGQWGDYYPHGFKGVQRAFRS